jgi:hypothetical protein
VDEFFDWASKVMRDLRSMKDGAVLVGVVLFFLTGPPTVDRLQHPDLLLYQTVLRTIPLSLTVCCVIIALSKNWFADNPFVFLLFTGFTVVLSAGIADAVGCHDCGGTTLIQSAHDLAYDWTPKWFRDSMGVLNIVPFLIACLIGYFRLYGLGTFIASFICGLFLAAAIMRLAKPSVEGNSK